MVYTFRESVGLALLSVFQNRGQTLLLSLTYDYLVFRDTIETTLYNFRTWTHNYTIINRTIRPSSTLWNSFLGLYLHLKINRVKFHPLTKWRSFSTIFEPRLRPDKLYTEGLTEVHGRKYRLSFPSPTHLSPSVENSFTPTSTCEEKVNLRWSCLNQGVVMSRGQLPLVHGSYFFSFIPPLPVCFTGDQSFPVNVFY